MKSIEQHIDNMFSDLPDTEEIRRIKNDLYLNALDRYDELINSGKTESEALGTVIIEMGERDVLLEELGYNREQDLMDYSHNTLEEAKAYIALNEIESNHIGFGIFIILFGAGLVPAFNTFGLSVIGVILLLILVASAVGIFINSGLKIEAIGKHLNDEDNIFYLSDDDYFIVEDEYMMFKEKERYRIPMGVMLCIVSVIPLLLFAFMENTFLVERFGIVLLTSIVGIGIYQFIKYGMINSAYEKILNLGEYSVEEQLFQKRVEPFSGVYWTLVSLLYFIWSFTTMNWGQSWIIWPIAGILWGLISVILKNFYGRKEVR